MNQLSNFDIKSDQSFEPILDIRASNDEVLSRWAQPNIGDIEPEFELSSYEFRPKSNSERKRENMKKLERIEGLNLSDDEEFAEEEQGDGRLRVYWTKLSEIELDKAFSRGLL